MRVVAGGRGIGRGEGRRVQAGEVAEWVRVKTTLATENFQPLQTYQRRLLDLPSWCLILLADFHGGQPRWRIKGDFRVAFVGIILTHTGAHHRWHSLASFTVVAAPATADEDRSFFFFDEPFLSPHDKKPRITPRQHKTIDFMHVRKSASICTLCHRSSRASQKSNPGLPCTRPSFKKEKMDRCARTYFI